MPRRYPVIGYVSADSSILDRALEVRLKRQELLSPDSAPDFLVILDEAALRRTVGGATVMRHQISHLMEMTSKNVITLQVVPFSAGVHPGMLSGFMILEFAGSDEPGFPSAIPSIVFHETPSGADFVDQEPVVQQYQQSLARVRSSALSEPDTLDLLTRS